jgi:hypothetical protein
MPVVRLESVPLSTEAYESRTERTIAVRRVLAKSHSSPAHFLCRVGAIFRTSLWRIGVQLATSGERIDLGPSFENDDEGYLPNAYTSACAEGIRTLQATRPVPLDNLDLHKFLAGFDAGVRRSTGARANCQSTQDKLNEQSW